MKQILLFYTFIFCSAFCNGQTDTIKDANLTFKKPNSKWFLHSIKDTNGRRYYIYKREPIIDSEGRNVIPNIAFVVETEPDTVDLDVVTYSAYRRGMYGAKTIGMFNWEGGHSDPKYKDTLAYPKMQYKNVMGFKAIYKDWLGEHTIYLVFLMNKHKCVTVVMDITSELFPKYQKEFVDLLWSIKDI